MRSIQVFFAVLCAVLFTGCTPEHTAKTGTDIVEQSRFKDAVIIRRSNDRLLSRQAQICLVSAVADTDAGRALLQNMQAGMSGYFLAVGVETRAVNYADAIQQLPCPGANYVLFVQPVDAPCKNGSPSCHNGTITDLLITVLNADNSGLADRITLTLQRSWLSLAMDAQVSQRDAFEKLARELTGTEAP